MRPPLQIGDTVGAYRILAPVGRGGMGEVYKAEHAITRRVEALKILAPGTARAQIDRFLREIQIHASLNHPNIAAVHNAFWVGEELVMVMEYVEGASLKSLLERGRIPLATALDYISQALAALGHAHAHGIVHRDVTPANMLITPDGTVKLTDFGLAKSPAGMHLTQTGALMGSVSYMAPEQIRGELEIDGRADLYSLGAVLYELATGKKPFDSENAFSVMVAHVEQAPVSPADIDPALPPALSSVILTALAKRPEERFQSAGDFLRDLDRVRRRTPDGSAIPAPAGGVGSRRSRWALVAALPLAVIIGTGLALLQSPVSVKPPVARSGAQPPTTAATEPVRRSPFAPVQTRPADPAPKPPEASAAPARPRPEASAARRRPRRNRVLRALGRIVPFGKRRDDNAAAGKPPEDSSAASAQP